MKSTILYYNDSATGGSSDKEYRVQVVKNGSGFHVQYQYGRRGGTLTTSNKTKEPVPLVDAERVYEKVVREKLNEGYLGTEANVVTTPTTILNAEQAGKRTDYPAELLEEIDEDDVEIYIKDPRYIMQPKVDGHRRQAEKLPDGSIVSYNKKGGAVTFPPEVEKEFKELNLKTFVFDGELVGTSYIVFDLLMRNGQSIAHLSCLERLDNAEAVLPDGKHITLIPTWKTEKEKRKGFAQLKKLRCEGGVFKLMSAPYRAGRGGYHKKFKFLKICTAKVIRIGDKGHNSCTLALERDGKWIEVGGASLIGKDKRIKVASYVDVKFMNFTGTRLYQPRIVAFRDDQDDSDCGFAQLKHALKGAAVL